MLGATYRYQAWNNTGVSVTVTVKDKPLRFGSDGSLTIGSEATQISAVSVGAGAYSNSSTVDNTTAKNLASDITWTAAPGSSATGTVALYLQRSTDGGTTWPTNGEGEFLGDISFASSATAVTANATVR